VLGMVRREGAVGVAFFGWTLMYAAVRASVWAAKASPKLRLEIYLLEVTYSEGL
jgi:hypothetical protein